MNGSTSNSPPYSPIWSRSRWGEKFSSPSPSIEFQTASAMTRIPIRNYHLDGYGHVNNARYLEFFEEARWNFFGQHRLLPLPEGIILVVARIDIRYLRAAREGQTLAVDTRVRAASERRVMLEQTARCAENGRAAAQAAVTLASVCAESGAAADLPFEFAALLSRQLYRQPAAQACADNKTI
ncbi:acyl-CoA thioesterase [Neisseria sp. 19428wB4_WF04]|nr:acyl-CoA thioesterase [Neisseria sp. 19428wB4_WF04]TFU43456.1 acyl-CoA thioesterase [Neisseria sp. WF04]